MTTYIESCVYYCTWKVENTYSREKPVSPTFLSKSKGNLMNLKMRLCCNRDSYTDALEIEGLRRTGLSTVIKVSILNSEGRKVISIREDFGEGEPGLIYFRDDIRRRNAGFTICCRIYTREKKDVEYKIMLSLGECVLVEDIAKFYLSPDHSDVVIRAENEEFPAHRFVLLARSPVFSSMFHHDTREKNLGVVEINDLSAEVIKQILYFMYTGQPPKFKDFSMARKLHLAAEKYAIKTLKRLCENFLVTQITAHSVFEGLITAHVQNSSVLKGFCLNLISSSNRHILKDEVLDKITNQHPELLKDIFKAVNEDET